MAKWVSTETQTNPLPELPHHQILMDQYQEPLLQGSKEDREGDGTSTATFAKTCFNGLNALSGLSLSLSLKLLHVTI